MAEDRIGEVQGGNCSPHDAARELPNTETATEPPVQPRSSTASRPSRADAKYEELLAQAREIMADPEFMEEVMALVRLKMRLRKEAGSLEVANLLGIKMRKDQ